MKIFGLPGTSFSPRRAIGVDVLKRTVAKKTGVPLTKSGSGEEDRKNYHQGCRQIIRKIEMLTGYFPQKSTLMGVRSKNTNVRICKGIIK